MDIMRLLRRNRPASPSQVRTTEAEWREFSAASFTWCDDAQTLQFTVDVGSVKVASGFASVELKVFDHGLQIVCLVDGSESDAILYLGNWFIVPPQLRRRGLARAVLLACMQTFQLAAFGRELSEQRVHLQGYFIGAGVMFSRAACHGVQPTKAEPAPVDMAWMSRSKATLQMDSGPIRID